MPISTDNHAGDLCRRLYTVYLAILVFAMSYSGSWAQCETKLVAEDGAAVDEAGKSVAVSGNLALVGAHLDDDNGTNSGSAYVFRLSGTTWQQEQKLLPADGATEQRFGTSVALSGDVAVVGAYLDDDNGSGSGSAYVFRFDGSQWVQEQKLLPSDGAPNDSFGYAVGLSGNIAIIGAYYGADDSGANTGAAYVFHFNGSTWTEVQKLRASDGAAVDLFGSSVGLSNDVAVIGAHLDDDLGSSSGSAYVFRLNGLTWVQEQKLLASDGAAGDWFGGSVAVSDDSIVIGSVGDADNGTKSGSAYAFRFNGSQWIEESKILAWDGAAFDKFGVSVAVSGAVAVVGAHWWEDNSGIIDCGSAYVFRFNGSTWDEETQLVAPDGWFWDYFGGAVGVSGDYVVSGAIQTDASGTSSGAAYAFDLMCSAPGCASNADCDDEDVCTNDTCSDGICQNTNNANACNDGDSCTTNDVCSGGLCSGTLIDCDDGNACTTDFCSNGVCQHPNNANACNDSDLCTTNDVCSAGLCSGTPIDCNDNNPCTTDFCSNGSCQHTNNTDACNDGDACTIDDSCSGGTCAGTALDCDDGVSCTVDICANGVCDHDPAGCDCLDDIDCDDGNACTNDSCSNGTCQNTNNTASCNDLDACTTGDRCSGGICTGTLIECDDGVSCTLDSCTNGVCEHDNAGCDCLDDSDCADGNSCTTDICDVDGWCVNDLIGNCCGNGICEAAENPCNCSVDCDEPSSIESDCKNGLDDDCDGSIDENDSDCESVCSPFGAACTTHSECCSGKCGSTRGALTCKKIRRRESRRVK